ncbi:glutamate-5-semialdehyde dehydrogenase [Kitasatospora sp. NPDC002543]
MVDDILHAAREAFDTAPPAGDEAYARYCHRLADDLGEHWPGVLAANAEDLDEAAARGLPPVLVERLRLTGEHLAELVRMARAVPAELRAATAPDPGVPIADWGVLRRVRKPLGVALMIYEARPTVTVEGALLFAAAGNAVLLRGGKEIARTNAALGAVVRGALTAAGLPAALVTVLEDPSRKVLRTLVTRSDAIDVLVPRGGPSLIDFCRSAGSVPLLASGGGVNHLYVHRTADPATAAAITLDSKIPAPAGCTSLEVALVDGEAAEGYLAAVLEQARRDGVGLTLRLDPALPEPADLPPGCRIERLGEHDLGREFLDATIGVVPVAGPREALALVRRHGSGHTEGVVSGDPAVAEWYARRVDASAVVVNGSLRLNDGPTLGLGSEIAISTSRLHARGPVTIGDLFTHSWLVEADGRLRGGLPGGGD